MALLDSLRKNLMIIIITVLFAIWMVFLVATSMSAGRVIEFHDALILIGDTNVNSEYTSVIPLTRYLFEPFIGLTFTLGYNTDPSGMLYFFLFMYIIVRIALLAIDSTILHKNGKKEVIFRNIKDILEFVIKWESILFLLGALIIIGGLFVVGFIFVANVFSNLFHIGAIAFLVLLIVKTAYNVFVYFIPGVTLKVKKIRPKYVVTKVLHRVKRELLYFWSAFLIITFLNFLFLGIKFPTQQIVPTDPLDANEILIDFHVHTTMSDGHLTPEQRVLWYIEQGIDAAVFTDHSHPFGAIRARTFVEENNLPFTVLIGQEYTDDPEGLHLGLYGIEEAIVPTNYYYEGPYTPQTMNVSEAIAYTKAQGGYVIVNHYSWNASAPFSYEQLVAWGVDGFELRGWQGKYAEIRNFTLTHNTTNNESLVAVAASDQHLNNELDAFVRLRLVDDPTNRSLDNIMRNLRYNNHSVILLRTPPPYVDRPIDEFDVFYDFQEYLMKLDGFQALSWIIWSCIGFALAIFVIRRVQKADLAEMEKNLEINP